MAIKQRFVRAEHEEASRLCREISYEMQDLIHIIEERYPKNVSRRISLAKEYFHKFQAAMDREFNKEVESIGSRLYRDRHYTAGVVYFYDPTTGEQINLDTTDSRHPTNGTGSSLPEEK